jgi:hypothetical protein
MKRFLNSQRERISQWGILRTLGYYALCVAPDKVGIKLFEAYKHVGRHNVTPRTSNSTFSVLESAADWTERDAEVIKAFLGEGWLGLYGEKFARGSKCAVTRWGGSDLACLLWVHNMSDYWQSPGQNCVVLTDAVTVPEHRGKGLFPLTLSFACDYASEEWGDDLEIYADVSLVNYASKKGLHKAGFVRNGWSITALKRTWFLANHSSHRSETNVICPK